MSQLRQVKEEPSTTDENEAQHLLAGLQAAKDSPEDKSGLVGGATSYPTEADIKNPPANAQAHTVAENRHSPITIGEALEATAITAGSKLVERSDAAAIQAAEVRATGRTNITPGGLAATAQAAAQLNARTDNPDGKITLADILTDASSKLPKDKPATRQDAEGVVSAELRNNPDICTHPTGVAASVVAAARLNQYAATSPDS
ncbi:hypothetical protein V2J09_008128 [Rumex salicifolius]